MRALALQLPRPSIRAVLLATAAATLAAAVAALLIGDSGGERAAERRVSYAPAPPPPGWKALRLPGAADRAFVPRRWRTGSRAGVATAVSSDRSVAIGVAAFRGRRDRLPAALRELRRRYVAARPSAEAALRIARLPAVGVEVALRARGGRRLRALVISARGRRDTYLIQAFTREGAPPARIRELRRVLATARLR